jgi:hypothetical protein
MMSYWKRVDEGLIKPGEKWLDMVGGEWLRRQYPVSRHCSENISSLGSWGPVSYIVKALKSMLYMNVLIVSSESIHLGRRGENRTIGIRPQGNYGETFKLDLYSVTTLECQV